ncbi:MAG: TonB-dependent receptor, partial [Terracidiphilus sp.]
ALIGQSQSQPANGSNKFTIAFMSAPYLPHFTKPSGKDTVFLTLSGTRQSTPDDFYATVPTIAERGGDFSASGLPPIYNPVTGAQFASNTIPNPATYVPYQSISPQAAALLAYFPQPLPNGETVNGYNYHLLTTAQSNQTNAGIRYNRSLGANATQPNGRRGFGGGRRASQNQGLRQSINFNYSQSHSASDLVSLIPELGGKRASNSYALQAGYTVGYHRITSISNVTWNRSDSNTTNFFTNTTDNPAGTAGISVPNNVALNYGVPTISLSNGIQGLSDTQPSFSISQTIAFSEVLSWIHGKHNMRYGGDYRRVHRDFLAGSNATGNFAFTGLFTEQYVGGTAVAGTGSSIADFLLGLPQSTSLNSSLAKSYLRDNTYDAYATDDWRVLPSLTLNYGVRWEFFAPYLEKYNRLADIATNPGAGFTSVTEQTSGENGLPSSLVFPWHKAFQPRVGIAWRVPKLKSTVLRAGFGTNYTVGEYAGFATNMAHQPPYTNEQTNQESAGNSPSIACAQTGTCFTLANGFPAPATVGNYALNPHYGLPYVMAWNLDLQKTLPLGMVLNLGYNGARSNHLDVQLAPRALPTSAGTDPSDLLFTYDEAEAYYKNNQATVRLNKRLQHGVSLGANYQYGHAIDDASSVNGSSGATVVQDWQNLAAQEGHSILDVRHQVTGNYLFELPFGPDKFWVTTGVGSHILEGFSVSGSFTFATGGWVSPSFEPTAQSVECGNTTGLRPNLVPGQSPTIIGGLRQWFNTAAYAPPSATTGFCNYFGSAPRDSIEGPGTVSNNMALSKTMNMGETRSMEIRAQITNVFNTVQYAGVNTTYGAPQFGQVDSVGQMRQFQFLARFRF